MIISTLTAASLALIGGFLSAPVLVDEHLNRIHAPSGKAPSPAAMALHQSLWIADLHADSLLWQRNLNRDSQRGHVDFPACSGPTWRCKPFPSSPRRRAR